MRVNREEYGFEWQRPWGKGCVEGADPSPLSVGSEKRRGGIFKQRCMAQLLVTIRKRDLGAEGIGPRCDKRL